MNDEMINKIISILEKEINDEARFYLFFYDLRILLEKKIHHHTCRCADCNKARYYAKVFREFVD